MHRGLRFKGYFKYLNYYSIPESVLFVLRKWLRLFSIRHLVTLGNLNEIFDAVVFVIVVGMSVSLLTTAVLPFLNHTPFLYKTSPFLAKDALELVLDPLSFNLGCNNLNHFSIYRLDLPFEWSDNPYNDGDCSASCC